MPEKCKTCGNTDCAVKPMNPDFCMVWQPKPEAKSEALEKKPKSIPAKLLGETVNPYRPFPFDVGSKMEAFDEGIAYTRSEIAKVLKENNVISLVPGQSSNLGLMLTAEVYQRLIAELEESCQTKE